MVNLQQVVKAACSIIGSFGWPNWQIVFCGIKHNLEVYVMGENDNLLFEVNFCPQLNKIHLICCHVRPN
jgi:hypothetical protein